MALAWLPVVLLTLFVVRRALGLYVTTGQFAFIQGRYLFGALVPPMVVVAVGIARALGRGAVGTTLALVMALQVWTLAGVLRLSWAGPGTLGPVKGMLAWSPWPPLLVVAVVVVVIGTAVTAGTAGLAEDRELGRPPGGASARQNLRRRAQKPGILPVSPEPGGP